jgi:hypothetical protein
MQAFQVQSNVHQTEEVVAMGLFKSREEREAQRQRKLELHRLRAELKKTRRAYNRDVELHQQSHAEHWEYLEVSSENRHEWGGLDRLGSMGWELVSASTYVEGFGDRRVQTVYVFKRKVHDLTPDLLSRSLEIMELETRIGELEQKDNPTKGIL